MDGATFCLHVSSCFPCFQHVYQHRPKEQRRRHSEKPLSKMAFLKSPFCPLSLEVCSGNLKNAVLNAGQNPSNWSKLVAVHLYMSEKIASPNDCFIVPCVSSGSASRACQQHMCPWQHRQHKPTKELAILLILMGPIVARNKSLLGGASHPACNAHRRCHAACVEHGCKYHTIEGYC